MLTRISAKGHAGGIVPLDLNRLYLNYITILGSTIHTDAIALSLEVAAQGHLGVPIDQVLSLSDAIAAHRRVAGWSGVRKICVEALVTVRLGPLWCRRSSRNVGFATRRSCKSILSIAPPGLGQSSLY
jgi:hypothetical protein